MIALARGATLGSIRDLTASAMPQWLPWLFAREALEQQHNIPADRLERSEHSVSDVPRVELEIGFGKGRYLLQRAAAEPRNRFLGIEIVSFYFRLVARRAARREVGNVSLMHAEALYALSTLLPSGFADTVHVYHPDPWPKARHHKRRLFDVESLDLLLSALKPTGELLFGSDHLAYADVVERLLRGHPALEVESLEEWPGGPRTHYEAKFVSQGLPVRRLVARWSDPDEQRAPHPLHPEGRRGLASAWMQPQDLSEQIAS